MLKMLKNRKGSAGAVAVIIVIVIVAIVIGGIFWWQTTHYSVGPGSVGVVTDQIGGIVRVEKGPLGFAEKSLWESVKYYDIMVRTEDMISPSEEIEGAKIIHPEPLENLRYGAIPVNSKDVSGIYIDISCQWHIEADEVGWEDSITSLYLNYPGEDYETKTVLPAVRDAVRNYASRYTCDEIVYTKVEEFSDEVTLYVQEFIDDIETLDGSIIIDKVFVRARVPPVDVQKAYLSIVTAEKEAQAILTIANATRDASIRVAEGQSQAIELVVNATSESVRKLTERNVTATDAIEYLGLQYTYDRLKEIAAKYPDWKLTIFINAPQTTYTIPIIPDE